MIYLNTLFKVTDDLNTKKFLDIFKTSMEKSSNIKLKPVFDKPLPNDFVFANSKQNATVYATDKYAAIRLSVTTSDKISIETYVFAKTKHGNFVSITADESLTKFSDVNKQDKIMKLPVPRCLYELLWQDFGGDDNGLRISDRPLRLRKSDVPMMTKILKRNLCPEKPIIYITPSQSTGDYAFDAYEIAAALPGIAHVIVADNPFVSELISNAIGVPDAIADNGEAMVILPDGQSYKLTDDDTPAATDTIEFILESAKLIKAPDELSFDRIESGYLKEKLSVMNNQEIDDLKSQLDAKISENEKLFAELDNIRKQNSDLKAKNDNLSYALNQKNSTQANSALDIVSNESPLYKNEIEDVILKIIAKEYHSMQGDTTLMKSRKFDIIKDLAKNNEITDTPETIRTTFEKSMRGGTLNRDGIRALERNGFTVTKAGSGHYNIVYHGDERYQTSMSVTPSDRRSGDNMVTAYMNMLFGF